MIQVIDCEKKLWKLGVGQLLWTEDMLKGATGPFLLGDPENFIDPDWVPTSKNLFSPDMSPDISLLSFIGQLGPVPALTIETIITIIIIED